MDRSFIELLIQPVVTLINHEVRQCVALLKRYEVLHLDFDARTNKYRSLQERSDIPDNIKRVEARKEAKVELDIATSQYLSIKETLTILCTVIEKKKMLCSMKIWLLTSKRNWCSVQIQWRL